MSWNECLYMLASILIVLVSRHDKQLASLQQKQSDILKEISDIKLSYLVSNIRGYWRRVYNLPIYNGFVWSTYQLLPLCTLPYCFSAFPKDVWFNTTLLSFLSLVCQHLPSQSLLFSILLYRRYTLHRHTSKCLFFDFIARIHGWMDALRMNIDSLRMWLWLLAPHWSTSHEWGVPWSQHGV